MMIRDIFVLYWLFLHFFIKGSTALRNMQIRVPEAVVAGSTVTLSCDYDLEQVALYTIKWYIGEEEFYRYVPKESPPTRVFPMPNINVDVSRSDAREVTLRGVQRELTGYYQCEVSADAPLFHTDIRGASMTVVELPTGNPILRLESQKVEIGEKIRANCTSPASFPAANITWFINNEKVTDGSIYSALVSPTLITPNTDAELRLDTSRSSLELIAIGALFAGGKATFRCEANIFSLVKISAEGVVLEDTPHLAPVMGPTAPQRTNDEKDTPNIVSNRSLSRTVSQLVITLNFMSLFLMVR